MTEPGEQANLLGAFAQVIADRMGAAVEGAGASSVTTAAALAALRQFLESPTLDQLRQVLGLTPSGAVRLVDRMAAADLVTRGPGSDGRSRSVRLTARGRRTADRVMAARLAVLEQALAGLNPSERKTLYRLLGRAMGTVVAAKDGGAWICRLCDIDACGRNDGRCPTANAAEQKYRTPVPPR